MTYDELDEIRANQIAFGAFCGMIFNSVKDLDDWSDDTIRNHIILALRVRKVVREMR